MPTPDAALAAFKHAWMAGERPDPRGFLETVRDDERAELGALIDAWVELAPNPPADHDAIAAEPRVAALLEAFDAGTGPWGAVLPPLRAERAWSVDDLAARLVDRLGLGRAREAKAADYLTRMERGELAPAGVSRRALDALGELLGTTGAALAGAATAGAVPRPVGGTRFRGQDDGSELDFEALSDALHEPAPADWDAVDELFCGGR